MYMVKRGDTLSAIAKKFGLSLQQLVKANPQIKNPDKIQVGQTVNIPGGMRKRIGAPTIGSILDGGDRSESGPPTADKDYLESAIKAVGISGWGGPFILYRRTENNRGADGVTIPRSDVSLKSDPLASTRVEIRSVYPSVAAAQQALKQLGISGSYAYYRGEKGIIFPTVISDSTAPGVCEALRKMLDAEKENARAVQKTAVDLLLWYVGARFPPRTSPAGSSASSAASATRSALDEFTVAEQRIIQTTQQILASDDLMQLHLAHASKKAHEISVAGHKILYEPAMNASGFSLFGERGFILGKEAFVTTEELTKTILHELSRLHLRPNLMSNAKQLGSMQSAATQETNAVFNFAERAYLLIFKP